MLLKKKFFKFFKPLIKINFLRKKIYLGEKVRFNSTSYFECKNKLYNEVNVVNSHIGYGTYIADKSKLIRSISLSTSIEPSATLFNMGCVRVVLVSNFFPIWT